MNKKLLFGVLVIVLLFAGTADVTGQSTREEVRQKIQSLSKKIKNAPESAKWYYRRGINYQRLGQDKKAKNDYRACLEFAPDHALAHHNLGIIYMHEAKFQKAKNHFRSAIEHKSDFHKPWYALGYIATKQTNYKNAIKFFTKSIQIKPTWRAYDARASSILQADGLKPKKKLNRILSDLTDAIRLNSSRASLYHKRGLIYKEKGEVKNALQDYAKALKRDSNFRPAYISRGELLLKLERQREALQNLKKAQSLRVSEYLKKLLRFAKVLEKIK